MHTNLENGDLDQNLGASLASDSILGGRASTQAKVFRHLRLAPQEEWWPT